MIIEVRGLLIDHTSKLLLARPAAANRLVLPGTTLQPGVRPETALDQAIRQGSGLIVMPVRLVALSHGRRDGTDCLSLIYRCIMRGGTLQPAGPYAEAGFFDPQPLPRALPATDRLAVDHGLRHAGGPPTLLNEPGGLLAAARGVFGGKPAAVPGGANWSAQVVVVSPSGVASALSGRAVNDGEAPWDAAAAVGGQSLQLTGIYLNETGPRVTLAFAAAGGVTAVSTGALSPLEAMIVADAAGEQTAVRLLPGA